MSDKENNLNKDDDNIQFDKLTSKDQKNPDRPSVNTGTAPLKRLTPRDPQIAALTHKAGRYSDEGFDKKLPVTGKLPDLSESEFQGITDDKHLSKSSDEPSKSSPISGSVDESKADDTSAATNATTDDSNFSDTPETEEPSETAGIPVEKIDKLDPPDKTKPVKPSESMIAEAKNKADQLLPPASDDDVATPSAESDLGKPIDATTISDDTSRIANSSDKLASEVTDETDQDDNTPDSSEPADKSDRIPFEDSSQDTTNKPVTHARRSELDILQDGSSFLTFSNKKKNDTSPEKNPDTAILPDQSPAWKKVIDGQAQGTTGTIGEQREVLFVIRGMIERVVMKDNTTATLGRFDTGTVPNEEIDLIPYGAIDRGVSRRHCEILLRDNQLHVVDLGSTNGTFLAGVRLKPNEATLLRKGDELLLGRLAVQVLFR